MNRRDSDEAVVVMSLPVFALFDGDVADAAFVNRYSI
jgi:hypothetical protein